MLDPRLEKIHKQMAELHAKDDLMQMAKVLQEAIAISMDIYGENHDETLSLLIEYGGVLRNLGQYEEALPILQRALRISKQMKGVSHPDYASSLINLANLLRMMKHFSESEKLFLEAKAIYERTIGKNHFLYAGLCNNLGLLYQDMGRFAESIPLHRICLSILKNDPDKEILYAVTLNNMVAPYCHIGQREKAIETLKTAIEVFRRYIHRAPVFYAAAINNLGTIYFEDQRYEEAKECFAVAVKISREKLGTQSESYQNSVVNYNKCCKIIEETEANQKDTEDILSKYRKNISHEQCSFEGVIIDKEKTVVDQNSKGLEISEAYFFEVCYPALEKELKEYLPRMAAGLIGEGSECYGYDDLISRDHDWGPSFQIYIPAEDVPIYGKKLRALVDALPKSYACFDGRNTSEYGGGRIGLFTIEDFYDKFLSIHSLPETNDIWLQMKDYPLSTATNGKVFMDNLGVFTSIREGFLKHYPRDVQLKKIAAECMQVAQSGQYNFSRSINRQQFVAAHHALDQFIEHYASIIYLLNKVYKPYYKWEHEGLKSLPVLGMSTYHSMNKLVSLSFEESSDHIIYEIESMCKKLISVLRSRGLTSSRSDFLLDHGPQILSRIQDPKLKNSNPWT